MFTKLFKPFLFEEVAPDLPPQGLTAPVDPAPEDPSTPPPEDAPVDVPEWMKAMDPELAQDPSIQIFKDVNSLAKSYIHSRKVIGKDKVVIPDGNATADDWKDFYSKMGLPEREKYEVKFGEAQYSDDFKKGFLDHAHDSGLLPKQAEKIFDFFNNQVKEASDQANSMTKEQAMEAYEGLKQEWGSGYDKKLKTAQTAFNTFADEGMTEYLNQSGLAHDTNLIRLFSKIGERLNEDTFDPNTVKHLGITKEEATEKRDSIMGNTDHPYWNSDHANHGKAVEEVLKYNKIIES